MFHSSYRWDDVSFGSTIIGKGTGEMTKELQYEKDSKERIPYEHYMDLFQKADPEEIRQRTGIPYDSQNRQFTLRFLGITYRIKYPEFDVTHIQEETIGYYPLESAVNARILVLRYLAEAHAAPGTGKFLTYREVPWGNVYLKQFQGRCIMRLAYGYGNKQESFCSVMERIGGEKLNHGDCSYQFEFLNGLYMQMILWAGDEEFPPSAQILFSDNFPVAFKAEDMAVAGDISISMIKALAVQ